MSTVKIKGVYYNVRTGKYVAQYWSKDLKTTICIGTTYNTQVEALEAKAKHLMGVYDGTIDDTAPKTKGLPKGISEKNNRYQARVQSWHGKNNSIQTQIYIGVFDTIDEAVEARKKFILDLL